MCKAQVVKFLLLIFGFPQPRDFSEAPELPDDVQVRLSIVEMRRHARCHAAQRETAIIMALLSHLSRRRRRRRRRGRGRGRGEAIEFVLVGDAEGAELNGAGRAGPTGAGGLL